MPHIYTNEKLFFTFLCDFIKFVHCFYEKNIDFFKAYEISGVLPFIRKEDIDEESFVFLIELLKRCRREQSQRIILSHVLAGRIQVDKLRELANRLGERPDKKGGGVKPDLIGVFGFKVYGMSNHRISEEIGFGVKRVKNMINEIYHVFLESGEDGSQNKLLRLQEVAMREGFIPGKYREKGSRREGPKRDLRDTF